MHAREEERIINSGIFRKRKKKNRNNLGTKKDDRKEENEVGTEKEEKMMENWLKKNENILEGRKKEG